jgi:DNA-binding helix-hairpin-helix protein with protein kinase domain
MGAKNPITETKAFRAALGTHPDPETAQRFGVSTATVRAYRQAAGIPAFTEVRRARVDALVAACTDTTSDIARTAGVSRRAVTKRRAALGDACAASPFDAETDARREALLAHVAANPDDTVTEAARAVGMSRSRAYAILARQRTKETAP